MKSVENQAILTYQRNLQYIEKEQPELKELLYLFEKAIESSDYSTQLELEYLDSYFDILDLSTHKYLYGGDSLEISKKLEEQISYNKKKLAFEGIPTYHVPKDIIDTDDQLKNLSGILRMMNYYNDNKPDNTTMKEIKKFIFIGTGLGLHIPMIHNKINGVEYLIVEDNLEIFKLSLFTTKYFEIAKNASLTFAIADDENMFLDKVDKFLTNNFFYNKHIKYSFFPSHSIEKMKQIQTAIATQGFIFFPYKSTLRKTLKPLEFFNDGYKSINIDGDFINSKFKNKPALLIAAGPSFKKNIEWVKKNQNKFTIVAVTAVVNTLYQHNIKPDILTQLDGSEMADIYYDNIDIDSFFNDTIIIFGANVREVIRKKFKKENIYYFDEGDFYIENFGAMGYPCIGSMTLALLLKFQIQNIYLLGLDLAINQETGATHSTDHDYVLETHFDNKDKLSNEIEMERNLFVIQGNFQDTVYTNALLQSSVQALYRNINKIKSDKQSIYNLNNGAKLPETIPTHIKDIDTNHLEYIEKIQLKKEITDSFLLNSIENLSLNDINSIKLRLKNMQEVKVEIEKFESSLNFISVESYLYELLGLVSFILKKEGREYYNIRSIFLLYFKYALNIILDFFNTKEIKKQTKHLVKFNKLLLDEMYDICNIYINKIEKFIEEKT